MIVILLTSMEKLLINISGRYVLPDIAGQLLHFALTNIQLLYWFEQGACATGATNSPFLKALFLSLSILFVAKVLPMYSIKVPQIHPRPPPPHYSSVGIFASYSRFLNIGCDFWGVVGDVWRWLCRHVHRKFLLVSMEGGAYLCKVRALHLGSALFAPKLK